MENKISFLLTGRFALFSDPITRVGGEKCSYLIPTYEALRGVCESVYWKPTIEWVIDRARVMNRFQSQSKGVRPIAFGKDSPTLSIYTYLRDVSYQVEAHFERNVHRPDLEHDYNENKHYFIAKRSVERGGRRDVFLGTRECQGYVEPCAFGAGAGAFDGSGEISFGLQFHGFDYGGDDQRLYARLWYPRMIGGVIAYCRPEDCPVRRNVKPWSEKDFRVGENLRSVDDEAGEVGS